MPGNQKGVIHLVAVLVIGFVLLVIVFVIVGLVKRTVPSKAPQKVATSETSATEAAKLKTNPFDTYKNPFEKYTNPFSQF